VQFSYRGPLIAEPEVYVYERGGQGTSSCSWAVTACGMCSHHRGPSAVCSSPVEGPQQPSEVCRGAGGRCERGGGGGGAGRKGGIEGCAIWEWERAAPPGCAMGSAPLDYVVLSVKAVALWMMSVQLMVAYRTARRTVLLQRHEDVSCFAALQAWGPLVLTWSLLLLAPLLLLLLLFQRHLRMHSSDNVTVIAVCFSQEPPQKRVYGNGRFSRSVRPRGAEHAGPGLRTAASVLTQAALGT